MTLTSTATAAALALLPRFVAGVVAHDERGAGPPAAGGGGEDRVPFRLQGLVAEGGLHIIFMAPGVFH
jgi:hypothetical protein